MAYCTDAFGPEILLRLDNINLKKVWSGVDLRGEYFLIFYDTIQPKEEASMKIIREYVAKYCPLKDNIPESEVMIINDHIKKELSSLVGMV